MKTWNVYYLTIVDREAMLAAALIDTVFFRSAMSAQEVFHAVDKDYEQVVYVVSEQAESYPNDFDYDDFEKEGYPREWYMEPRDFWEQIRKDNGTPNF